MSEVHSLWRAKRAEIYGPIILITAKSLKKKTGIVRHVRLRADLFDYFFVSLRFSTSAKVDATRLYQGETKSL